MLLAAATTASWFTGFSLPDVTLSFFAIILEGAPFLLLGAIASGLVDLFLPPQLLRRFLPKSKAKGVLAAIAAGFFFPLCECGAMPVISRLVRKGIPTSIATTYLLATPLLNPLTLLSTWLAFRSQDPWLMVGLRLGFGTVVVFFIGIWLTQQRPEKMLRPEVLTGEAEGAADALVNVNLRLGAPLPTLQRFCATVIRDFLGVLIFLVIGAGFAAVFSTGINRAILDPIGQSTFFGPLAGIGLAQVLCLCSTTDAFIIATFASFSVAAKIAFLVAGPLFDLKLFWLYQSLYQRKFVVTLWALITGATLLLTVFYGFH
ncbi:MAG: hypothetical protein B9S32_13040 [Verrucomicrobia bacterium Tous-C9LFEB]|nr:MAG: hypothetical protein B9S32_13040 [Verrucomicrobia bacterium Tous-C9LFEB]